MIATGTFDVSMQADPPFDEVSGVSRAHVTFDKVFAGDLSGRGSVSMVSVRTTVEDSAAYVALERITGSVGGRTGSFVVLHTGVMTRGALSLIITVAPDSGTDELAGISGSMSVANDDGSHTYELDYEFDA